MRKHDIALIGLAAIPIAALYRGWLVVPALHYVGIAAWYFVAVVAAAVIGVALSFLLIYVRSIAAALIIGLLLGGTWAFLRFPSDIPISFFEAFTSHLRLFWLQLVVLTCCSVGAAYSARAIRQKFSSLSRRPTCRRATKRRIHP
ncbi:MAG TPA: hypothetical protein VJN69_03495 [Candidatus Acidoferrales bacterium]|jgi:hypothetical protein|nr:hypothetical protein [Candidatus Acidoferrales bacterium]